MCAGEAGRHRRRLLCAARRLSWRGLAWGSRRRGRRSSGPAVVGMLSGMKRIGLLGGMSWESSAQYYRFINEATRERLGGLHSADCVLRSVDFADIEQMQSAG